MTPDQINAFNTANSIVTVDSVSIFLTGTLLVLSVFWFAWVVAGSLKQLKISQSIGSFGWSFVFAFLVAGVLVMVSRI